jgi:alginate O-acetyltransferase complex protein AlgI
MLFSDPTFFLFFAVYFLAHLATPPRWRPYLIIIGSTVFYGWWRPEYVWLPYLLTVIAWIGVIGIDRATGAGQRRGRLVATLVALFLPLAVVKYAHFFAAGILGAIPGVLPLVGDLAWLKIPLPLGISFVTFTLTAYVVDVYARRFPREPRVSILLAYVLFFPHLIAGPILRPHELMPQLGRWRRALDARFTLGVALFSLGLVKKLVFADTISGVIDHVYSAGAQPTNWEYLLAIYGFAMQIYCDFSGYTDMAIGLAYLVCIRLPTNFLRPYGAGSVIEFWRRWHITLSHWLRDYLYIPLGGSRLGTERQAANLMITMTLGGLWHGANWTFVIWGFLHGLALTASHLLRPWLRSSPLALPRWLAIAVTFHFVTLAWVFFRAPDMTTAMRVLTGPFVAPAADAGAFAAKYVFELLLLAVFLASHTYDRHARVRVAVARGHQGVVWIAIATAFVLAIALSQGSSAKFIYFDF